MVGIEGMVVDRDNSHADGQTMKSESRSANLA